MEVPLGSEKFTFPNVRPSSPPSTPGRSRNTSATSSLGAQNTKRFGIFGLNLSPQDHSPPENLAPRGLDHQFSYTPPDREDESSDSSDADDVTSLSDNDEGEYGDNEDIEDEDSEAELESRNETSDHRRPSIVRHFDEQTDFTLVEVSENDMDFDSETEVVRPDQTEDAESEVEVLEGEGKDLIDALKQLYCDPEAQEKAQEFEAAQQKKYYRKKKRWSIGGIKKRSHADSVGSDSSSNADIDPLEDFHQLGSSARRLRRRTQGPADAERPRTSLLFEDPPKELEELSFGNGVDGPPALVSDSNRFSDAEVLLADEEDRLVPAWLMMLVDSDVSRPPTAI